ncbi:CPBP family intramembrane glutamic endopeptidase [Lentilitoribacter sp. EG35]|uniref:CPBP family intramembrane glutamic endopeptidase n=1 Tax=Lentilitoribacter sp. EG35 TaxID=3234192 RepID=UPI0034614AC0
MEVQTNIVAFLALTFAISICGFICIAKIPGAHSPDNPKAIPFWLITVWGPSLAAILLSYQDGRLVELLARIFQISTIPDQVWLLVIAPILLLLILSRFTKGDREPLRIKVVFISIAFNLILGPLGEELGWRGFMQEDLNTQLGWLETSIFIGFIWYIWHLPLWTIQSPQSEISIYLFGFHCLAYSIIIGAAYTLSGGSILPAILIHLTLNLASNWALFVGLPKPNDWFRVSIIPYFVLAVISSWLVYSKTGEIGLSLLE